MMTCMPSETHGEPRVSTNAGTCGTAEATDGRNRHVRMGATALACFCVYRVSLSFLLITKRNQGPTVDASCSTGKGTEVERGERAP
jgi:hypothetical protein